MKMKFLLPVMLGVSLSLFTNCKPAAKNEVKLTEPQDSTPKVEDTSAVILPQ